jgi:hypothetical protein
MLLPDRNHDGMPHDAAASKSAFARKTHGKPSASCGNSDTKKNRNLDNLECHTAQTATQDLHCILRHTHTHILNPKIILHVGTQEHIALHCHGMHGFVGGF